MLYWKPLWLSVGHTEIYDYKNLIKLARRADGNSQWRKISHVLQQHLFIYPSNVLGTFWGAEDTLVNKTGTGSAIIENSIIFLKQKYSCWFKRNTATTGSKDRNRLQS